MNADSPSTGVQTTGVKQCCAALYESDFAKLLLGDSFHPGGLELTERLGRLLQVTAGSRVLDVAAGGGVSALFLAERFGCRVVGIDYSERNVEEATRQAAARGLKETVSFERADAEALPFPDGLFDVVFCECAFCTFPGKAVAAREFARVLRDGGRVGLSDLTRAVQLSEQLKGLLAWIACIGDAQPLERYAEYLRAAGLTVQASEVHDEALAEMVRRVQAKLFGAELLAGLKKLDLQGVDLAAAKQMAGAARDAIEQHQLGYALITAEKKAPSTASVK